MSSRSATREHDPVDAAAPHATAARHTVVVNGQRTATSAATLAALLIEAGHGGAKVATALNGEFVAERARAQTRLADGDQVEIVAPRQGG